MNIFKRHERAETLRAYKRVFESDDGKKILGDMMKAHHIYRSTMDANPYEMAYREGERSVVLRILRAIKTDPAEIEKFLNEQDNQME